jgi:eukaryotic-like serine/threonine-protein kinase
VIGQTVSHYAIVARIGAGATGDVYKAEDSRLHRFVALKVMAPHRLQSETAKRRFIQEAHAASALDHPNICTIHDIGETDDGRMFLVMSLYEGETLAAQIARGPLAIDHVARFAEQIAAGLSRAHEFGIVHRDIKPANLFVTRFDEVKILDFGLAKLHGDSSLTQPGTVLGTNVYMSPEQASGAPLDHRSDIWSLGVVIYEMLTGRRPFEGDAAAGVFHSIRYDQPRPLLQLRPETPAVLAEIVERALNKSPSARVQSCHEIRAMLRSDSRARRQSDEIGRPETLQRRSIMVVPFVSLGGDATAEYFGDGLAEDIITNLSRVRALRVIARSAAARVRTSGRNLRKVAHELDVEYIVDGAVRRQGTAIRVSANLSDARTGSLLWAEQFAGTLDDIFSIQETLSRKIVEALRIRLSVDEHSYFAEVPLADVHAYEYYLKAKQEFVRYEPGGLQRALQYIEQARARVGDNVLLLAAAGQIYWQLVNSGSSVDRRYLDRARGCAERILELDPDASHGHRLVGMVRLLEGDIQGTIRLLETAAIKDPNDTDTLSLLGPCYGYVGRPRAGVPCIKRLLELDPLTPMYQALPGILALMSGSFDEAVAPFATSFRMDPGNPLVGLCYGQALALNGSTDDAVAVFDELQSRFPSTILGNLGQLYRSALIGRADQAAQWVTPDVEALAEWDLYHAWNLAECYALLGDTPNALKWLTRASERGMLNYPLLSRLDPFLQSIRSDPRFDTVMTFVRRGWEAMSAGDLTSATTRLAT